jgi:hypothetical protein
MGLSEYVARLSALHAKAKRNEITPGEKIEYETNREELAATILNAQKVGLKPNETARAALRVNRVLPIELKAGKTTMKAVTLEISSTGFAVMLAHLPAEFQDGVDFRAKLPGGTEINGVAMVANTNQSAASVRAGFAIVEISDADREQLTRLVFDDLLDKLSRGPAAKRP